IGPEQSPNQEVELSLTQVEPARAQRPQARGQVADAENADQAVDQPHGLPQPVALYQVLLALDEADERVGFAAQRRRQHAYCSSTCSASTSASSIPRPESSKNRSSRRPSWLGRPSASTRP